MKIVVDAMGGDYAPKAVVSGAILALEHVDADLILVGRSDLIQKELSATSYDKNRIEICDAAEFIDMNELAAVSVRKKRNSSIVLGIKLLKEKKADAFVSAGNTGAVVCAATLSLGLLPGIERPGISILIPTLKGVGMITDVGANINSKPVHLLQYAVMSDSYLRNVLQKPEPKIGLLNIGEEETKGTSFLKDTFALMEKGDFNFIGNIEAKDIFNGKCDAVICDGFVGNIALKILEGAGEAILGFLKKELKSDLFAKLGVIMMRKALVRFKRKVDYSEYGGAPLLGVDGVVIIGHGRSSPNAVKNAIRVAKEEVDRHVNEKIVDRISHLKVDNV